MPVLSPLRTPMASHYEKGSFTNVGKLIIAKKLHHGWLHIDDVTIVAKSVFAPPKFFAGCGPGYKDGLVCSYIVARVLGHCMCLSDCARFGSYACYWKFCFCAVILLCKQYSQFVVFGEMHMTTAYVSLKCSDCSAVSAKPAEMQFNSNTPKHAIIISKACHLRKLI